MVEFDSEEQCAAVLQKHCLGDLGEEGQWAKAKGAKVGDFDVEIEMRVSDEGDLARKSAKEDSVYYKFYNRELIRESFMRRRFTVSEFI